MNGNKIFGESNKQQNNTQNLSDPFGSQRKSFNEAIRKIINMLNQVFTNNYVLSEDPGIQNKLQKAQLIKIETSTSNNNIKYTYEPLSELFRHSVNQMDGQIKNTLFRKVCKNIIVLFAKPLPPKNTKTKASLPLNEIKPVDPNEKRIIITTPDGQKIFESSKTEVCSEHEIYDFKNYIYLKLKLLVYLNDILNLDQMGENNQYEKLFLDYMNKNPGADVSVLKSKFDKWMQQVQLIIEQVMSDTYNFDILRNMVALFENADPTTVELCESVISLCDNKSSLDVKEVCSPKRITMYSVTEDVCNPNLMYDEKIEEQKMQTKKLSGEIEQEMEDFPIDTNEFSDQVEEDLDNLREQKKKLDSLKEEIAQAEKEDDKKKTLSLIEDLNMKSKEFIERLKQDPILNIQKEVNKIDFEKIKDPQVLKKATLALKKFGNVLNQDKTRTFLRDITNINRDLRASPFVARSNLKNLFDNQVKPIFEKQLDKNAVKNYYEDLKKKTDRELLDEKFGYKDWFGKVVNQSKFPKPVQEQVKKEAVQKIETLSKKLGEAKTPAQKAQVVKQFQKQEKKVLDLLQRQMADRKNLVQSLDPVARKAFVNAFSKTTTLQEQLDLILAFKNLPKGKPNAQVVKVFKIKEATPAQITNAINQDVKGQDIQVVGPPPYRDAAPSTAQPSSTAKDKPKGKVQVLKVLVPSPEIQSPQPQSPEIQSPEPQSPEIQSPEPQSPEIQSPEPQSPEIQVEPINTPSRFSPQNQDDLKSLQQLLISNKQEKEVLQALQSFIKKLYLNRNLTKSDFFDLYKDIKDKKNDPQEILDKIKNSITDIICLDDLKIQAKIKTLSFDVKELMENVLTLYNKSSK
jgi:hypothetical protein